MTAMLKADNLRDFDELANPLVVPIGGKRYTIPPVGARTAQLLRRIAADDQAAIDALTDPADYYRAILGVAYDEMVADNCPEPAVDRAALAALADFQQGRLGALRAWEAGATVEGMAAVVAATNRIANGDSSVTDDS